MATQQNHKDSKKKSSKAGDKHIRLSENPPFALIEAFRNLATNVGFAVPARENRGRIVCISSSNAHEGKTTISVNMASSYAGAGSKTVLLDCDMRKPTVRKYFKKLNPQSGITEYLSGQSELEEALVRGAAENLDVIFCIKPAPNPQALIMTERFQQLLDRLASEYEYIIIDTPPVGIVSDALQVAEHTDGIILVARQMVSTQSALRKVVSNIDFAKINFLGFVLNDFALKNSRKGYYKKYDYKYGYSYGQSAGDTGGAEQKSQPNS